MGMAILAVCPLCKGKGKIPKPLPFGANPKAPATRADKLGTIICPQCKGTGQVGVE
jgi:RecJ-like exonuclease